MESRWRWILHAPLPNWIPYAWPVWAGRVDVYLPVDENDEADYHMGLDCMQSCLFL